MKNPTNKPLRKRKRLEQIADMIRLKEWGMCNQQIADKYETTRANVSMSITKYKRQYL